MNSNKILVQKMGSFLRERRQALGLSQTKLHEQIKTDPCRIESGKTEPKVSRLLKICEGLNLPPYCLFFLYDMHNNGILTEMEIIEIARNWDYYKKFFLKAEVYLLRHISKGL